MSTRRNEGASTGRGDGKNGFKISKKNLKRDFKDIEGEIEGYMGGESKERKELKRKRNLEVETAVAMLLGLAKSDVAQFATHNDTENSINALAETKVDDQWMKDDDSDLTKKGTLRLGPGDNRVRPPKAATKLLPRAKWRHIRLPDVVSALEAEDWVVMFVHFKYPDLLSKTKAESMLNFRLTHYDEGEMQSSLQNVKDTSELENFLKDKYGGNAGHRRQKSVQYFDTESPNNGNEKTAFMKLKNSLNSNLGIQKLQMPDIKTIQDSNMGTKDDSPVKLMNGHSSIQTAVQEGESLPSLPEKHNTANGMTTRMTVSDGLEKQSKSIGSPSKSRSEHANVTQGNGYSDIARSLRVQTLPFVCYNDSINMSAAKLGSPHSKTGVFIKNQQEGLLHFASWNPSIAAAYWPMSKKNIPGFHVPGCPPRSPPHITSGVKVNTSFTECNEKPGRPPSYDDMVQWCVNLKRMLYKRHVPLTIDDAVHLVNDPEFHQGVLKNARSKVLVASTLRKRVLGLYGFTWSQIATDLDPECGKIVNDPSILSASDKMLKKHGLNPNGYNGQSASQMPLFMPRLNVKDEASGAATALSAEVQDNREAKTLQSMRSKAATHHLDTFSHDKQADPPMGSKGSINQSFWQNDMGPVCLSSSLPYISDSVKDLLDKAKSIFLSSEEVAKLLLYGARDNLPLSEIVGYQPSSGSMYIFDRSKTTRFRCDGYEWTKRETHAKRKISNSRKINCYYAGGQNDRIQRRCYWILKENSTKEDFENKLTNLVFVHYLDTTKEANTIPKLDHMVDFDLNHGTGNNAPPLSVKQLISDVDLLDSESMFNSLCSFHRLEGISKDDCTTLCRMWMENRLDENQKRQMFVFIKNNAEDTEAVVHWLKKICDETH